MKELVQDEHKKHPYLFWFMLGFAFIYAFTRMLNL